MNTVQKIIAAQKGNSDTQPVADVALNAGALFSELHNGLQQRCMELIKQDVEVGLIKIDAISAEASLSNFEAANVYYSLTNKDNQMALAIAVSPALASLITNQALQTNSEGAADYVLDRLDVVLCKGLIGELFEPFRALVYAGSPPLLSGLTLDNIGFTKAALRKLGPLARVILSLRPEVNDAASESAPAKKQAKKAKKSSVKDNKATKGAPEPQDTHQVQMILPLSLLSAFAAQQGANGDGAGQGPTIDVTDPWYSHILKNIHDAHVDMRVVAETFSLSVADCTRLSIGQLIALPGVSLESLSIEVDVDVDVSEPQDEDNNSALRTRIPRQKISEAKLGIYKANRAICLNDDIDPQFFQDIKDAILAQP